MEIAGSLRNIFHQTNNDDTCTSHLIKPGSQDLSNVAESAFCRQVSIMESDQEEQENELLALEAIYDKRHFTRSTEELGGELNVYLDVTSPFLILLPRNYMRNDFIEHEESEKEQSKDDAQRFERVSVKHLPPLVLNFKFSENYPSLDPPIYSLSCKWLNEMQMTVLCNHLDKIWDENGPGSVILFQWVQFLTDEVITVLKIESPLQIEPLSNFRTAAIDFNNEENFAEKHKLDLRAVQDVASIENLARILEEYDKAEQTYIFDHTYFACNVCFMEKPGVSCMAFHPCSHVFCCDCMAQYIKVQINDGAIRSLTCPYEKCQSQANPSQVKKLVDSEAYEKYEKFLLQTTLDCMEDVMFCPRTICQSPVIVDEDAVMSMCPKCNFAFCKICKRSYHGVSGCPINEADYEKIRDSYYTATNEERKSMEKKYGKKTLKYVLEEAVSQQWIESNAKRCPYCKASIQKIDGCNKMTCFKCHNNFCWLCLAKISKSQPYLHFNNPNSRCFNKLFEGVENIMYEEYEEI